MVKKPTKKASLRNTTFSRWHFAAFILIFASLGGYIIYRGFAAEQTSATQPYFVDEFERSQPLSGWAYEPIYNSLQFYNVPGVSGNGVALKVTPTSSGPNASSELASYYKWYGATASEIHTAQGEETWYRAKIKFPSGKYFPTTGEWNWIVEWHNDDRTASYGSVSTGMGVATDFPVVAGQVGQNPRLWFRLVGGLSSQAIYESHKLPANSLKYDHWYDIVWRFVWKTDQDGGGHIAWWVDGVKYLDKTFPILQRNPDGTVDHPSFGLYNYRLHDPAHTSEVHFDQLAIGPTAESIAFSTGTTPPPTPAPTVSLTANPSTISSGQSSALSWSSTNATSCSASGAWSGTKATSGTQPVTPTSTSIYNLSCTGGGGTANASATVTVSSTPPPTNIFISDTNIRDGASVQTGTTWWVRLNTAVDKVEFWANGTKLSEDASSPYEQTLNLPAGSHQINTCAWTGNTRDCDMPSPGGVWATITVTAPAVPPHIAAADLNNDGKVNILDLSILLKHYGTTAPEADINGDGQVNITDLSALLSKYE